MRKQILFLGGLLLVGLAWAWIQGAQVPSGTIQSTDYDPGVTAVGTNVYNDLAALETAVNTIDSSQISETANIPGTRLANNTIPYAKLGYRSFTVAGISWAILTNAINDTTALRIFAWDAFDSLQVDSLFEQGVLQTETAGQKKVAYGDLWLTYPDHGLAAIDLGDTVLADSGWVQYIDFEDSSAVGAPGFPAAPNSVTLGPLFGVGTPAYFGDAEGDEYQRRRIAGVEWHIVSLAAAGCSVYFHNASTETTAVAGYKIFWEAKE